MIASIYQITFYFCDIATSKINGKIKGISVGIKVHNIKVVTIQPDLIF